MARKIKSPTRTISNRGQRPKFVGYFPCYKADAGFLPFDSIPALDCGLYLEWRSDVMRIEFEPERYSFEATGRCAETVEYSRAFLGQESKLQLLLV
jgi:hypothetical protein